MTKLVGRAVAFEVMDRDEGNSNSNLAGNTGGDRLLRPEQAAWYLNVKTSWVYEAVRAGRLPCHRVGRHIRFTRHMLDDWLAEQPRR
jgi:excisionase family DNA binding protein